jgi:hypothetical protein
VAPDGEQAVYFPLRSNAKALLTGAPVAALRRRMKVAGLLCDRIYLEAGALEISAGSGGGFVERLPLAEAVSSTWQTPAERREMTGAQFYVTLAPEDTPGVPSDRQATAVINSEAAIAWRPTFHPFARELGDDCDWVTFVVPEQSPDADRIVRDFVWNDDRDQGLAKLFPTRFARSRIVEDANRDFVNAALGGITVSVDRAHAVVLENRLAAGDAGRAHGMVSLPVLIPDVRDIGWEELSTLRRHRDLRYFRSVMGEIEAQAWECVGSGGDLEAWVRNAYDERLRMAVDKATSIWTRLGTIGIDLLVGTGAGLATVGFGAAPSGAAASAALSTAVTRTASAFRMRASRRTKRWVAADVAIRAATRSTGDATP